MRLLQQRLQLIVQPHPIPRPLILGARECPPQTLFGIGHKAQGQLLRHKPSYQTFRIAKVFLAPAPTTIGQGLRQMQASRHLACSFSPLTPRFPVSFQCSPYRFPILRRGFHYYFLDLLLDQPLRKQLQLLGVASVPASLELVFLVDFHVNHNHRQFLLMDINSGYPIWHRFPPGGSGERARDYIKQALGLSPLPRGERQRTIYSLYHARSGLDRSTVSVSPL